MPWVAALCSAAAGAQLPPAVADAEFAARQRAHWAWHALRDDAPPPGAPHPVDAFVQARLAAVGVSPSPPAPPQVALRRLWFDLVGLPPPPATVQRFLADPSDAAWHREVEALLASPHFGERQARHWLDLVRYAETLGHEYDFAIPNAWRYRDYVIRALNADVPFDQFVREHIAGDLLPAPRRDADGNDESVQATAAWWFAEQTHSPLDAARHEADRVDNQVDVLGKAVLGLTIACARCHDHKFDAIRAVDYFALFGFVKSSRYVQAPLQTLDVHGAPFAAAMSAQRAFAAAVRDAAVGPGWHGRDDDTHDALPPPRAGDVVIASVDDPRTHWFHTNDGFGPAPWSGPFAPDAEGEVPQLFVLPGRFWNSAIAGPRREGTLATPTFRIEHRWLHVRAAGHRSRIKVVVDGFHLVRDPIYGRLHHDVDDSNAHWRTFDLEPWLGRTAFVQCIDQRAHDLADPRRERREYPAKAWLAVQSVVASPGAEPPPAAECLPLPPRGLQQPPTVSEAAKALAAACQALPVSPTLPAIADGTGVDAYVHVRGDPHRRGAAAPRRFLQALGGGDDLPAAAPGSGRLQLAETLLRRGEPLVARVLVNRAWHHLFGRGLVRSVDNLGALGDVPTHPELLDWLARDAIAHGWSPKHVLRRLVTSATYRQDSRPRGDAVDADASNLLLHRQNVRRLTAEAVRDAMLAISGRLDATLYGPSIELPHATHIAARGQPSQGGPVDGDGRRSIYLAVRRNFLPPMLQAFDLPTPFATVGARNVSNVPAQVLALANDPFVHAECARWAESLPSGDDDARLLAAYERAFARGPTADERSHCRAFLAAGGEHAWPDLLHALVVTTEFQYLR